MSRTGFLRNGHLWAFALILALGAVLRLLWLGYTWLWIDEMALVGNSADWRTSPVAIIVKVFKAKFGDAATGQHMPFQYVWLNVFMHFYHAFGIEPGTYLYRFPFALSGILALPLLYGIGLRAFGRSAGLWIMALGAISFFHVYQTRDATGYGVLILCVSLNFWGLAGLAAGRSGWRRIMDFVAFVAGAVGAMLTNVTALLLLAAEGAWLVAAVVAGWARAKDPESRRAAIAPWIWPAGLLAASAVPFILFLVSAMSNFWNSTINPQIEPFSLPLLEYQVAHFGWGRGAGRLSCFVLAVLLGVGFGVREGRTRWPTLFATAMLVLSTALFFAVLKRDFAPRYLSIAFVPLLVLAGYGVDAAVRFVAGRLPFAWGGLAVSAAVLVCLAAWHIGPYRVMYRMRDKLMPFSRIHEAIMRLTPPGGLYIWRNGYHMREIPGRYPVPDRYAACDDFPNVGVPPEIMSWRSQNGLDMVRRHPLAPLITDPSEIDHLWSWIRPEFKRQEPIYDDTMEKLWAWGLSAYGKNNPRGTLFNAYYNTEADVLDRLRQGRGMAFWPAGAQWRYMQLRDPDARLLASPQGDALLKAVNFTGQAATGYLVVRGLGAEPGSVRVSVPSAGGAEQTASASFSQSASAQAGIEVRIGPFALEQGESMIRISQFTSGGVGLLIHSFEWMPAAAPAPAGAGTPGG